MRDLLFIFTIISSSGDPAHAAVSSPTVEIISTDVAAFYRVYDASGGKPSAEALQRDYISAGSSALQTFAVSRGLTGDSLAKPFRRSQLSLPAHVFVQRHYPKFLDVSQRRSESSGVSTQWRNFRRSQ